MVPTDYRLDQVAARLIERLEGTRPTFRGAPERLGEQVRSIASDQVEAAIAEFSALGTIDEPERHAAFLRKEILQTMVPRYVRLAAEMNDRHDRGWGFGAMAGPVGRLVLVVVALLVLWLVLLKLIYLPVVWPLILVNLSLPFWPDIAAALFKFSHQKQLQEMVDDMTTIQEQAAVYMPAERLHLADEAPRRHRRKDKDTEH